ncbi:MAG TPA: hypothetical protein EYQ06_01240 [Flavobacteriales bacterium]|nr:hypothetical protein [Flavobacteriales bacterium]
MLKKIFLSSIIFSFFSCSYIRTKHITKEKEWHDYLPATTPINVTIDAVIEDAKNTSMSNTLEIGESWTDPNGQEWIQRNGYKIMIANQAYTGWWIYGEGQHIFKDEQTLGEWELTFPNENMQELVELYLAVCEMEYFPMECNMIGHLNNDTLKVIDFEITYIQGCGE